MKLFQNIQRRTLEEKISMLKILWTYTRIATISIIIAGAIAVFFTTLLSSGFTFFGFIRAVITSAVVIVIGYYVVGFIKKTLLHLEEVLKGKIKEKPTTEQYGNGIV